MEQLGRYLIQEEIGKGGMGIVYRAYDPDIDRNLALKVLRPERTFEWEVTQRFLREAKAAGRLTHPNIVTIYDVGEDDGRAFIAMEFLEGTPLSKLIKERKISFEEAVDYAIQIAGALDYAHKEGVVHRDIKPSNIIITDEKRVKITDFGIARVQDVSLAEQTRTGQILGTPSYMAPEQVQGKKVDGRADLFSLGIILYEMISGKKPYEGDNIASLFHSILTQDPEPITRIVAHIPKELDKVLSRALEKDREKRYQTGKEFARDLALVLEKKKLKDEKYPEKKPGDGVPSVKKPDGMKKIYIGGTLLVMVIGIFFMVFNVKQSNQTDVGKVGTEPALSDMATSSVGLEKGEILFQSHPEGALVLIEGEAKGKTPLKLNIAPGSYEVRMQMPGYLTWEAQINVEKGQMIPLYITLTPEREARGAQGG